MKDLLSIDIKELREVDPKIALWGTGMLVAVSREIQAHPDILTVVRALITRVDNIKRVVSES